MKGYVLNTSRDWTHTMKRSVGPGAKIPLNELYTQYGKKHNIEEGEPFVSWLRTVKLKDTVKWRIVTEEELPAEAKVEPTETPKTDNVAPMVAAKMEIADVVGLSVRNARNVLPKINDLNLLKYALQEANQMAGKDSLCRLIRSRIKTLQISR